MQLTNRVTKCKKKKWSWYTM